jgi:hypothetical protein
MTMLTRCHPLIISTCPAAFSPPVPEDDTPIVTVPQRTVAFKVPVVPPSAAALLATNRPQPLAKPPVPGGGLREIVRVRDVGDASSAQEAGRSQKVADDTR